MYKGDRKEKNRIKEFFSENILKILFKEGCKKSILSSSINKIYHSGFKINNSGHNTQSKIIAILF